ncbi:MAG: class I SAM-dependent rRNA methyltransferase [Chloroflexi bacterium]|nr:class I SAM-dependent rRNA methyltransferase [Chloroflexota bacterium]
MTQPGHDQGRVVLKPGRDKPVRQRHPWVFSGAVARMEPPSHGPLQDGDVVVVADARGQFLARGYLNRRSQIVVRLLTWDPAEQVDDGFWLRRLQAAVARRGPLGPEAAGRLVHAESDLLPGLIVDRYADYLAVQFLTLGVERRRELLVRGLADLLQPRGIFERSDVDVRSKEGLGVRTGLLWGDEPPDAVFIHEGDLHFLVDLKRGQKTGFYLDQRENRSRVLRYAAGAQVLNGFAFSGGFGLAALQGGARHVVNVDESVASLELAERNFSLNGWGEDQAEYLAGDMFQVLRGYRQAGRTFDLIILDPPKFAHRSADVQAAARGYKDINLLAFQLLRPGGILFTFSCSGAISADLFQKVVFGASVDAQRDAQILERLTQASDHPVLLAFPESDYLKGLVCRVL